MADVAKKITQIGTSNHVSEQNEPEEPWLRQKGEPAKLYLWFKRYLQRLSERLAPHISRELLRCEVSRLWRTAVGSLYRS